MTDGPFTIDWIVTNPPPMLALLDSGTGPVGADGPRIKSEEGSGPVPETAAEADGS